MLSLDFEEFVNSVERLDPDKSLLVFVAEQSQEALPKVLALLKTKDFTVAGGVFPKIIFEQECYSHGFLVVEVELGIEPMLIEHVANGNYGFEDLPLGASSEQGDPDPR
jgi:hypothetical protein